MSTYSDGTLVKVTGTAPVYLIVFGETCWVPDPPTFESLFPTWDTIQTISQADYDAIPPGPQITSGAYLATTTDSATIYFISWGMANPVTQAGFSAYQFGSSLVQTVSQSTISGLLQGWTLT